MNLPLLILSIWHAMQTEVAPYRIDTRQPAERIWLELERRNARNLRAWRIRKAEHAYHMAMQALLSAEPQPLVAGGELRSVKRAKAALAGKKKRGKVNPAQAGLYLVGGSFS